MSMYNKLSDWNPTESEIAEATLFLEDDWDDLVTDFLDTIPEQTFKEFLVKYKNYRVPLEAWECALEDQGREHLLDATQDQLEKLVYGEEGRPTYGTIREIPVKGKFAKIIESMFYQEEKK